MIKFKLTEPEAYPALAGKLCGKMRLLKIFLPLFLIAALLSFTGDSIAQSTGKTISGIVRNNNGEPMQDVSVTVKGTRTVTTTDAEGRYTIKVPSSNSVLVFTNVGLVSQQKPVGNNASINVTLLPDAANLQDVVVIGYGSVKRKDVTGSVARVNVQDLQKAPVKSVDDALAGRVAGVMVTSADGQPGSNAEITIRGVGSVTQSSAPLYVIDGFPQEDANFNSLNPAEIESIEVLKDASATAIYGARGSNGVIIITTKRGKSAKPTLTYNGFYGAQKPIKFMKLMSPYEYVRMQNDANPIYANAAFFTNGVTLEDYKNRQAIDWQDLLFNDAPGFQNHSISLSAKANKTAYTVSGSYSDQEGLIIKSGFKRYQARFTVDQDVTDKLKLGVNVNYANFKSYGQIPSVQNVPTGQVVSSSNWNLMTNLWSFRPVLGSKAADMSFVYEDLLDNNIDEGGLPGSGRVNPYISTLNEVNDRLNNTLNANSYLQYKITNDLTLRVTAGINLVRNDNYIFHNSFTNSGSPLTSYGQTYGVNGSTSTGKSFSFLNENTLTYNKAFNKNNVLNAVIGATTQKNNGQSYGYSATNIPSESLGIKGLGGGTPYSVSSSSSLSAMQSFLGRVNYTLFQNYLLTASFRADGTSKFYPDNRWGYFPSGAFAWRFGNEKFMKGLKFISDAKLRMSYGATGNNRVSDFAYMSLLNANVNAFSGSSYSFNNGIVYNITVNSMGNQHLKWETGIQGDVGLDLSLFDNRISIEADYYKKVTKNLLLNASQPYSTGFTSAYMNIGKVSNEGLEFSLNTVNVKSKNFIWNSSFNISFNRNRLLSLNNNEDALLTARQFESSVQTVTNYIAKVGQPIAQFYGYIADGMYQLDDFYKVPNGNSGFIYVLKDNIPYYGTKSYISNPSTSNTLPVQPGDPKFKDLNGDGILDVNDYTVIGNPYPIHFGGFSNNFTYKGFDLNIFLQWSYGNNVINANRIKFEGGTNAAVFPTAINQGLINFNMFETYTNRWTPENPSNLYPRVNANAGGTRQYSTRIIEDGSYLRLKTLQLGYSLPAKWLKRAKLSSARLYVSGQNLITLTRYTGPDPEVSTFSGSNLTPGFDYSPYPRTRVMTIGANISL
jgi:TonB-dependent starch-binding outer membrane protein SusC